MPRWDMAGSSWDLVPPDGDEAATLIGFLERNRANLRARCEGLDAAQLARTLPPSTMTLGGLLKHLAVVESGWLSEHFEDGPLVPPFDTAPWEEDTDWEWHSAADDTPEELFEVFDRSVGQSRRIVGRALSADAPAGQTGLDTRAARTVHDQERVTLRWILVHLIEEYAQHNGHADLLRESIDGRTGPGER